MKTYINFFQHAMRAILSIFFFAFPFSGWSQDFEIGAMSSNFSASSSYQSVSLSWSSAAFPADETLKAGYLIIYSTSKPLLVAQPNGLSPDYAVINGTIVSVNETQLPAQPVTAVVASGLADGTSYNFMIVAYVWDGHERSSYKYSEPVETCSTVRPDEPLWIVLPTDSIKPYSIGGSFAMPVFPADGYLVTFSTSMIPPVPENGHRYQQGESVGMATVALMDNVTSFNTLTSGLSLAPSTAYYFYAFSYTISMCDHLPVYSAAYATDSASTIAAPAVLQSNGSAMFRIVQNPVHENMMVEVNSPVLENINLIIYSSDGRPMLRTAALAQVGTTAISLQTDRFPKAAYFIKVSLADGNHRVLPFFKQ